MSPAPGHRALMRYPLRPKHLCSISLPVSLSLLPSSPPVTPQGEVPLTSSTDRAVPPPPPPPPPAEMTYTGHYSVNPLGQLGFGAL